MDRFDAVKRSAVMAAVGSKNTTPELFVRKLLFGAGYRYRLNVAKLPGKPDLVLAKYRCVIFVHGCFWHAHPGCAKATVPETRREFWRSKLEANRARDARETAELEKLGWRVLVIWECACKKRFAQALLERARAFVEGEDTRAEIGRADLEGTITR